MYNRTYHIVKIFIPFPLLGSIKFNKFPQFKETHRLRACDQNRLGDRTLKIGTRKVEIQPINFLLSSLWQQVHC